MDLGRQTWSIRGAAVHRVSPQPTCGVAAGWAGNSRPTFTCGRPGGRSIRVRNRAEIRLLPVRRAAGDLRTPEKPRELDASAIDADADGTGYNSVRLSARNFFLQAAAGDVGEPASRGQDLAADSAGGDTPLGSARRARLR